MSASHVFDDPSNVAVARALGLSGWIACTSLVKTAREWSQLSEAEREEIRVQCKREKDEMLAIAYWRRAS